MNRATLLFAPILLMLAPACARCDSTSSETTAPEITKPYVAPLPTQPRSSLVQSHLDASASPTPQRVERPGLAAPPASAAH